jgi:DNA-directed RNA polymerase subunit RPC12/RpoP
MESELECPICEADIPLDGEEKPGDLIFCSYCKVTFKILMKKGKWILTEDFEE